MPVILPESLDMDRKTGGYSGQHALVSFLDESYSEYVPSTVTVINKILIKQKSGQHVNTALLSNPAYCIKHYAQTHLSLFQDINNKEQLQQVTILREVYNEALFFNDLEVIKEAAPDLFVDRFLQEISNLKGFSLA